MPCWPGLKSFNGVAEVASAVVTGRLDGTRSNHTWNVVIRELGVEVYSSAILALAIC